MPQTCTGQSRQGVRGACPHSSVQFSSDTSFPSLLLWSLAAMAVGHGCRQQSLSAAWGGGGSLRGETEGSSCGSSLTSRCHIGLPPTEMDLPPLLSCSSGTWHKISGRPKQHVQSPVSLSLSSCLPSHQLSSTHMVLFVVTHLAAL